MRTLVLSTLAILLTFTFVTSSSWTGDYHTINGSYENTTTVTGSIVVLGFIAAILATIIPILELIGFKNRRNMDALLVLPVSRTKMALAHYLNGIVEMLFINAICFLAGFLKLLPRAEIFPLWAMLPFYALLMLSAILLYTIFFFIFMQANTIADGVIFMSLHSVLGMLVVGMIENLGDVRASDMQWSYFSPYSPVTFTTSLFERFITPQVRYVTDNGPSALISTPVTNLGWDSLNTFYLVLWCVIAIAAFVGFLYFFKKQRPEHIGGISNSPFGYMTLIPAFALSFILLGLVGITWGVIVLITSVVGYIIYRRSIRLRLPDLICLGVIALISIFGIGL